MSEKIAFIKRFENYFIGKGLIWSVLLAFTLLPLFIMSFYNNPQVGDDYSDAVISLQKGFWGSQKWWYLNLQGRYINSIMASLNPLVFNAYWAYKLNTIAFLILLLIAAYWLVGKLFINLDKIGRIAICSLFIFAYIIAMPSISYGIFMYTGLVSNLAPDILTLFLLGCIICYYNSSHKKKYFILSCVLIIGIIGLYDIQMVLLDSGILLFAVLCIVKKQKLFFPLSLLSLCIIFSIISVTAPGNAMRGLLYPNTHNFLFTIKETFSWGAFLLIRWLPFMLLIGLFLFDLLSKSLIWKNASDSVFIIPVWFSLLACVAMPLTGLFLCFWSMGKSFSHTWNGCYFYFVTGMFYFSFSSITLIKKRYPYFSLPIYVKTPAYLILIYLIFIKPNNLSRAYTDITSGTASAYNKEMTDRYKFLTSYKGDSCVIDSIKNTPNSFDYRELQKPTDDCAWEHPGFCKYYYHAAFSDRLYSAWGYASFRVYYHKNYIGIKGRK